MRFFAILVTSSVASLSVADLRDDLRLGGSFDSNPLYNKGFSSVLRGYLFGAYFATLVLVLLFFTHLQHRGNQALAIISGVRQIAEP